MKPLTGESPHAIIMIGIPGSGKSAFAARFADTFKSPLISQTTLQREHGLSSGSARLLRETFIAECVKTQRTLVIDGGLDTKADREALAKDLTKKGYRPMFVWVQTDTNEAHRRATKPYPQGSGLSSDEFDTQLDQFEPPHERERAIVISGKHTYTSQLKIVLKQLASNNPATPKYKQAPPKPSMQPLRTAPHASSDAVIPIQITRGRSSPRNSERG